MDLHAVAQSKDKARNTPHFQPPPPSGSPSIGPMGPSRLQPTKPIIGAVSGYAVAGGLELSLLCDIRVAEEDAVFGVFCRRWGVPLIDGGTVRLQAIVGLGRALDMVLTGRPVGAQEALAMGLANRVVAKGTAVDEAVAIARQLLAFPQLCMKADRESCYYSAYQARSFEDALRHEFEGGAGVLRTESVAGAARHSRTMAKNAEAIITSVAQRLTGQVATITISRPSKLNSLNSTLLEKLTDTFHEIPKRHPDLIAVVLTGTGAKSFIGGADIEEMGSLESPAAARQFITRVHHACKSIRDCPVPVIGRVNGYALGAGLEVAASCDFRVASSNAVFGMPEVRIGVPSVVEAALLPGLIGWGRTRRFLLLGDNVSAAEALQWGLVEKVVEPEGLDEAVEGWIQRLEQNGPLAVRRQKALMRQWEQLGLDEGVKAGIPAFEQSFEVEGAEGVSEPSRLMKEFLAAKEKSKASSKL
ncbi:hypothetical protein ATERTT37_002969 [Aspergillus terreus]